ncbi:MAG TPA: PAS domain-containing sensor histidine kinase [Rhizomicrobium sp.]|nr:PAS domain-containing sensor histidine kinase [Rhizomicrobium sp.]
MAINALSTRNGPGLRAILLAMSRPSRLALAVGVLAVLSGIATYAIVTGLVPYNPTPGGLIGLLIINLTLVLTLGALIAWRLVRIWSQRRSGIAGAKLHIRLVVMFSAIAVVPTILVAIFAAVTLNLGVEAWFSERVKAALSNAVSVAQAYVEEHRQVIRGDILAMAYDIDRAAPLLQENETDMRKRFTDYLVTQASVRALPAVFVIDSNGRVLASAKLPSMPAYEAPSSQTLAKAAQGQVVVLTERNDNLVRAMVKLDAFVDAYLLVARAVDPEVLAHQQRTIDAASEYNRLNQNRAEVQLIFAALYAVVSLVILLAAIWAGLWAATRLVRPISSLIGAAERVSEGDLKARVEIETEDDEMGALGRAFNRMTSQLSTQRDALVEANQQNEERRRFTEAVLAGVSAGVIGLDNDGRITIVNVMAARLLNAEPQEIEGQHYSETVPELSALIRRAIQEPVGRASGEATLKRGPTQRNLSVQVASESGAFGGGYVVTFDDITDLISAQRTAAWADVARRIAHEIKNPLTPIQLSAERLKRKYSREITTEPEIFEQCTDTIIRQVGDIGRMVDEFSSFARMPTPKMRRENAQELLQQAVFLQRVAQPGVTFTVKSPKDPIWFEADGRLVAQALTNVLKNAGEAIESRKATGDDSAGQIAIALEGDGERFCFHVSDNGIGLPPEHRNRLTEPYVTTRAKGTGLGLAIVRKIMEDHGGDIAINDAEDHQGAEVRLTFPLKQKVLKDTGVNNEQNQLADSA